MLSEGHFVADGKTSEILYDRHLLEENHLELPLALMTHELLHDKLSTGQMDAEHKRIIAKFLHAHRHSHGPEGHDHVHIHFHTHEHDHMPTEVGDEHIHDTIRVELDEEGLDSAAGHHHHSHDHDHSHGVDDSKDKT